MGIDLSLSRVFSRHFIALEWSEWQERSPLPIPQVSARCATHQSGRASATGGGPILADRGVAILVRSEATACGMLLAARLKLGP